MKMTFFKRTSIAFLFLALLSMDNLNFAQSTCNIPQINAAMAGAGFQPLNVPGYPCALYYYNPNQTSNWNTAQNQAAAVGATLLTVCNQAENDAVWQAAVAAGVTGGLWIGYSDAVTEGSWLWLDGSNCAFTNWNPGEPNNTSDICSTSGEDVAIMQMSNGRWNDVYANPGFPCLAPAQYASLVKVNICPQVTPTASATSVCIGDAIQLTATTLFGSSPYTYNWTNASLASIGTGSPLSYTANSNATLTVTATDQYGCTDSEVIAITANDCNPQDASICCPYEGWEYVMPIVITNNTPLATTANLQTLLTIDTQTPISANKMQSSGADIRFVQGVCGNYLTHYIESGLNTTQTKVWVKLPSITANSSETIYLYYGNATATTIEVPFTGSAASMFPNVLTVTGSQNLAGTQTYDWIDVQSGATITTNNGQPVILSARKIIFSGSFDGLGRGYTAQTGPGSGATGNGSSGGGGGAYGGNGGVGGAASNAGVAYGTITGPDTDLGSGGGNSDCNGASGGGNIQLNASVVELTGIINVKGATISTTCNEEAGGGGAGGGVIVTADYINGNGTLNAEGGQGSNSSSKEGGGGGGGGRIKFFYSQTNAFSGSTLVGGGLAGTGGQSGMQPGSVGSFNAAVVPGLTIVTQTELPVSIPSAQFTVDDVCENNPSVFNENSTVISGGSITSWQWNFGDGSGTSVSQEPSYEFSNPGQYNVTLTVSSVTGCIDSVQVLTNVFPGATAAFTATDICLGSNAVFTDQSTPVITSWSWNFDDGNISNVQNPTNVYQSSGVYSVELIVGTAGGCTDTITSVFNVYDLPNVNLEADQTICAGDQVTLNVSGATTYSWSPNTISSGVPFTPSGTATYTVTGTDGNGCTNTDQAVITVVPIPDANVSANPTTALAGELITFSNGSSNATSYDWDFGNGQSASVNNTADQTQSYGTAGTFEVILYAKNGSCTDSDTITVIIIAPEVNISIPNVFTVNGDGINDAWKIDVSNAKEVKVEIVNRWGNSIISLKANESWDGTVNGKDADEGVYFYKYEITDQFGELLKGHGNITLIRGK